jgi:HAD superfamily hydrolase (TIGR01509 family)
VPTPQTHRLTASAFLFDMDGTLVDSTAVVEEVWGGFAREHDLDLGALLDFAHGRQAIETVRHFHPSHPDPRAAVTVLEDAELARLDGIVEIPGARALLEALPPERIAVVTSAPRPLAEARLRAAGLRVPAVLVTAGDVSPGKPDPGGYLLGARRLGADPASAIAFEDADAGIRAARASGAITIVVGSFEGPSASGLLRVDTLESVRVASSDAASATLEVTGSVVP